MRTRQLFFALSACASLLWLGACTIPTGPNSYIEVGPRNLFGDGVYVASITPTKECVNAPGLEEAFACLEGQNEQRLAQHESGMERERRIADRIYRLAREGIQHDPRSGYYVTRFQCHRFATPMWVNACELGTEHGTCDATARRLRAGEDRLLTWYNIGRATKGPVPRSSSTDSPPTPTYHSCPGWASY